MPWNSGQSETPPRTWRRRLDDQYILDLPRNTSTDVEKTQGLREKENPARKHLHGRGEDLS